MVIDVGAGDGRFVVKTATAEPSTLTIGIDANASRLYDGFRRAQRARLGNALFVVASADALPGELTGTANEVRIQFPWGSLLTAVLEADHHIIGGIADLLESGGRLAVLVSVAEHDGIEGIKQLDDRAAQHVAAGVAAACGQLVLDVCRPATKDDVVRSHSTWAKRLGVGRARLAWLLQYHRRTDADGPGIATPLPPRPASAAGRVNAPHGGPQRPGNPAPPR